MRARNGALRKATKGKKGKKGKKSDLNVLASPNPTPDLVPNQDLAEQKA